MKKRMEDQIKTLNLTEQQQVIPNKLLEMLHNTKQELQKKCAGDNTFVS